MVALRDISLKLTLIGAITLFSALTLIVVLIGAHHSMDQALVDRAQRLLIRDMEVLSQLLQDRNVEGQWQAATPFLTAISEVQDIYSVNVLKEDLTPYLHFDAPGSAKSAPSLFKPILGARSLEEKQFLFDTNIDNHFIGVYHPLALEDTESANHSNALLFISYNLKPSLDFTHRELLRTATLFTGIGSLGLLGMLLFFRRYVTAPLQELASGSEKMAAGNYDLRFKLSGNNEIGRLAATLNKFAATSAQYIKKLEGQHKRLNDYLRSGVVGLVVLDEKGKILESNKFIAECTGYDEHTLSNMTFSELVHPDDRRELRWNRRNLNNSDNQETTASVRVTAKNGLTRWLDCNVKFEQPNKSEKGYFVIFLRDITARRKHESRIHQLAHFDELTLLPNRRLLNEKLELAIDSARRLQHLAAIMFIDLDFFKDVNDSLGHQVGDKLLYQVAERLKRHIRQKDTLARVGGDEFVLLIQSLPNRKEDAVDSLQQLGTRLLNDMALPYKVEGYKLHLTASAGVSFYPVNADNRQDLLRQADTAMYHAKMSGRNNLRFFHQEMQIKANERLNLRSQIQQAVDEQQFEIYFQPQVQVNSGRIISAECLIRWHHPQQGVISPTDFIPIAEESGLIIEIGDWVLEAACHYLRQLQEHPDGNIVKHLSINISPRQFHSKHFVERVKELINNHQVDAHRLCFEITENLLVDNLDIAIAIAEELKTLGISLSIDDFGTGYSSLSYLTQLPLDEIKIDKSFIDVIPGKRRGVTIVETILSMAKHLGARVVAEGVETPAQLAYLRSKQCDLYQGYLSSPPVTFEAFCNFLARDGQREYTEKFDAGAI